MLKLKKIILIILKLNFIAMVSSFIGIQMFTNILDFTYSGEYNQVEIYNKTNTLNSSKYNVLYYLGLNILILIVSTLIIQNISLIELQENIIKDKIVLEELIKLNYVILEISNNQNTRLNIFNELIKN
jgi:hypothetical protein